MFGQQLIAPKGIIELWPPLIFRDPAATSTSALSSAIQSSPARKGMSVGALYGGTSANDSNGTVSFGSTGLEYMGALCLGDYNVTQSLASHVSGWTAMQGDSTA